ncbi:MAG: electron transfer flavoprotein-ubiquinone oxidoreductase [Francisellaceae bacterium]|nr:electron transfer flavoprotein-ubiquinone oxidoreductase [Francisellaceae bacterium]MBT6207970.1 electron transfer flavoprotein-ubiquinone oxidoreductase [Francisellaceae bacterium]MBT6539891.1 electron transfer flavoprotein-ubiquinone oxidoreductase [Francisellaceae bacterium]
MEFDVVIVGAGPAGLATAISLAQAAKAMKQEVSICILEKGSEVGAHQLSGAVFDVSALSELIPNWQDKNAPITTKAAGEEFLFLTKYKSLKLPIPHFLNNEGNYVISLGLLAKWLASEAESLGVNIFPGFSAAELLIENDKVIGVATSDLGVDKLGKQKNNYQRGIGVLGKHTILAEGARGSLSQQAIKNFNLDSLSQHQTYGLGIKELWEVPDKNHIPGTIVHTIGWPLPSDTYGGLFIYHLENNLVSVGMVTGLDYKNTYLDPFKELQKAKHHPEITKHLSGGKRICYGARSLNEGGLQSIPSLCFPGGMLVGCAAGMLNVARIKGIHNAIRSGTLAGNSLAQQLFNNAENTYQDDFNKSPIFKELYLARNIRPGFHKGLYAGMLLSAIDTYVFRNKAPWTLKHNKPDHLATLSKDSCAEIIYPKPDNKISFDKLSSVFLSGTNHEEDQPVHLLLTDIKTPLDINLEKFGAPEQRYCPAGVYEIITTDNINKLQINAQNCLHCKACDIKDPTQNITWHTPEGGGGPKYNKM